MFRSARNRLVLALLIAWLLVLAAGTQIAGRLAETRAVNGLQREAAAALPLAGSALRAEIDRQRAVPTVLAEESTVRAILERPMALDADGVNASLKRLAEGTRASVLYLIDRNGRAVAASNYDRPDSFVGADYRFRRYFQDAMAAGRAEQYALGTVSGRPGLYIAERVGSGAARLGVVVAKLEFDQVEGEWAATGRPTFVTDRDGVVLVTSEPRWRFLAERAIPEAEAGAIRARLQSEGAPLTLLPVAPSPDGLVRVGSETTGGRYAAESRMLAGGPEGWQIHVLVPADRAIRQDGAAARLVVGLALALAAVPAVLAWQRRDRARRQRIELERRVEERTQALSAANGQLEAEIAERRAAEGRARRLRDDLAQANRLATLGQVTAGVAHEINQPLAAIRTYAENAGRFLDRRDDAGAARNMALVVELTDRISGITDGLRQLARRAPREPGRVVLAEAIEGALLILANRVEEEHVAVDLDLDRALAVRADRLRLEQVIVNLLRNALDALGSTEAPRIRIAVARNGEARIRLGVADNGPGIAPEVAERLFTPFSTTKPQGLGLGLVISQDIATELGGRLFLDRADRGALFVLDLPEARP